jgi:hypothetical protein
MFSLFLYFYKRSIIVFRGVPMLYASKKNFVAGHLSIDQ